MRKLPPFFFILAAFFLLALAVGLAYNRVHPVAGVKEVVHPVDLLGDHADPPTLVIATGEYVQFNSKDNIDHEISQGKGDNSNPQDGSAATTHDHLVGGLNSGVFHPDEGYKLQFKQAGSFEFHDDLHPKISITVIVYDPKK